MSTIKRYARIQEKNPREIVLLQGLGCRWRRCRFCDYHLDFNPDPQACLALNQEVLAQVQGTYGRLEVINSGSIFELDPSSLALIEDLAQAQGIRELYVEAHYSYRRRIPAYRERLRGKNIDLKVKCGVETFDSHLRDRVLHKGMAGASPAQIARTFDQACLLFGLEGQDRASMEKDISLGLEYFERICINLMTPNTSPVSADPQSRQVFLDQIYPRIKDHPAIDILIHNTDFGVGGPGHDQ